MKEFFKKVKPLDILILSITLSFVCLASFFIYSKQSAQLYVVIKAPTGEWIYSLQENIAIEIEGSIGITKIKIENGEAFVVSSACKNKTCVSAMRLRNYGDWNACLPNKVFLSIEEK